MGTATGDVDLGTFTGNTISDNTDVKGALQELETAHENLDAVVATNVNDIATNIGNILANTNDIVALQGQQATNVTDIASLQTDVASLLSDQSDDLSAGDNVNGLVASTTPDATPASYYYLAVDAATGQIKVMNKSFLELED